MVSLPNGVKAKIDIWLDSNNRLNIEASTPRMEITKKMLEAALEIVSGKEKERSLIERV